LDEQQLLNVSGMAFDDSSGLQGVTVNGNPTTVTDGLFTAAVLLAPGANTITVVATDNASNTTTDTRSINYDPYAPVIDITMPADNSKTAAQVITLSGIVDVYSAVSGITNNSLPVIFSFDAETGAFTSDVTLVYGMNTIQVNAGDLAGNTASAVRTVVYDNLAPALSITEPSQDITTGYPTVTVRGEVNDLTIPAVTISVDSGTPETLTVTSGQFEKELTFTEQKTYVVTITAVDEAGNSSTATRNVIYHVYDVPDAFSFTDQTGVPLNTFVTSNAISVIGINVPVSISISAGGFYSVSNDNGATWSDFSSNTAGLVNSGDQVIVALTSQNAYLAMQSATLTIGGVSATLSVTTCANVAPFAARTISQSGWTVIVNDASTDDAALPAGAVYVDWGDGTSQTGDAGSTFSKTYTVAGSYIIKHSVTDAGGLETWSSDATVTVPMTYSVSGRVLRLDGVTPVSGATVQLMVGSSVSKTTTTAADGTYTFNNVAPGTYTVKAIKSGLKFSSTPTVIVTDADVVVPIIQSTK
jgi:hypothetical protein